MSSASQTAALPPVGVYRYRHLIGGCPAYYSVDWAGQRSPLHIVANNEQEDDVIDRLRATVTLDGTRPPLRLINPSRRARPSASALAGLFSRASR